MLATKLADLDDVKKVVVSLMARQTDVNPKHLVEGLVGSGALTGWQGRKILSGASRGFYLGNYRILRPLGRGGMGRVYLGQHHVMKRQMALKILNEKSSGDPKRIERFKKEAEAVAQLDHDNIVRAYDFGAMDGRFYIVMEYVDGIDLAAAVARDGVMNARDAINVLTQAADALAHAHARGIIHRDIKPSNLLVRSDGRVKISDFGLARIGVDEFLHTRSAKMVGTADYLAPEQAIDSRTVDHRADIYALGCTLVYLMSGRPPFSGRSVNEILAKHQTSPIADLRTFQPDCPAGLAELATRMLSKPPAGRPRSMDELLAWLRRLGGRTDDGVRVAAAADATSDTWVDESPLMQTQTASHGFSVGLSAGFETGSNAGFTGDSSPSSFGEIDFGQLPGIDLSLTDASVAPSVAHTSVAPSVVPATIAATIAASPLTTAATSAQSTPSTPIHSPGKPNRQTPTTGSNQSLLLGIGLSLAAAAFVVIGWVAYQQFTTPLPKSTPQIKSFDDKDGRQVIVVTPSG